MTRGHTIAMQMPALMPPTIPQLSPAASMSKSPTRILVRKAAATDGIA